MEPLELGVTLPFVDARKVSIRDVAAAKRDIGLELSLVVRAMALAPRQAHRVVIRLGHLQTNIVLLISISNLRVIIHELTNANLIDFLVETSLDVPLLLSLELLSLCLLLQIELLEVEIAHLVVILVGHAEPGVAEEFLGGGALRGLPLQDGK